MERERAKGPGGAEATASLTRAEVLAARLDRPMGLLGVLFLFVVLGQVLATAPWLVTAFSVLGWIFWAVFVAEFILRAHIAGWSAAFWRRNWWQLVFLALPFLRFFRALAFLRVARVGRVARLGGVLSAGVRGSRSAGRLLSGRLSWLAAVTAVVILASSQLHYVIDGGVSYGEALYQAALTTITGGGLEGDGVVVRLLRLVLAAYSVVVFATLAGSLGAYFLQRPDENGDRGVEQETVARER
jgi:voltage-gated potassium channel